MKNLLKPFTLVSGLVAAIAAGSSFANAGAPLHGYLCGTFDRELMVRVYQPISTQSPHPVMMLVDPSMDEKKQLIGMLRETDVARTPKGLEFVANAVHAIPGPSPYIDGVPLNQIQWVVLGVNLATTNPREYGGIIPGSLRLQRANGQVMQKLVTCSPF